MRTYFPLFILQTDRGQWTEWLPDFGRTTSREAAERLIQEIDWTKYPGVYRYVDVVDNQVIRTWTAIQ